MGVYTGQGMDTDGWILSGYGGNCTWLGIIAICRRVRGSGYGGQLGIVGVLGMDSVDMCIVGRVGVVEMSGHGGYGYVHEVEVSG